MNNSISGGRDDVTKCFEFLYSRNQDTSKNQVKCEKVILYPIYPQKNSYQNRNLKLVKPFKRKTRLKMRKKKF